MAAGAAPRGPRAAAGEDGAGARRPLGQVAPGGVGRRPTAGQRHDGGQERLGAGGGAAGRGARQLAAADPPRQAQAGPRRLVGGVGGVGLAPAIATGQDVAEQDPPVGAGGEGLAGAVGAGGGGGGGERGERPAQAAAAAAGGWSPGRGSSIDDGSAKLCPVDRSVVPSPNRCRVPPEHVFCAGIGHPVRPYRPWRDAQRGRLNLQ